MRAWAAIVFVSLSVTVASAEPRALFWSASEAPIARSAERGFAEGAGLPVTKLPREDASRTPSLLAALDEARGLYRHFQFTQALGKLDELVPKLVELGGADLDATQLSDVYFYRWLCRGELGRSDGSWDDLVEAARLAPTRVIDAAQVAPRALASWKRAVAETAGQRVKLTSSLPPDAHLRVDGVERAAVSEVAAGRHFVQVDAPGYERWAGVVEAAPPQSAITPSLRPARAPDIEALPRDGEQRLLLGTLERTTTSWRFRVRLLEGAGRLSSEIIELADDESAREQVAVLTRRIATQQPVVITTTLAAPPAPIAAPAPGKRHGKLVLGLSIGGGVVVLGAIAIALGVVYGRVPSHQIVVGGVP